VVESVCVLGEFCSTRNAFVLVVRCVRNACPVALTVSLCYVASYHRNSNSVSRVFLCLENISSCVVLFTADSLWSTPCLDDR
jgi:hypothetical protein